MDREAFWKIIESSREQSEGDVEDQIDALRALLMELTAEEVVAFDHEYDVLLQAAYRRDIWTAALLAGGGCSDDGFIFFRYWLVAQGREVYESVLKDPEYLAEILDEDGDEGQVEGFESLATEIWGEKTGRDPISDFPDPQPGPSAVSRSEPAGERISQEDWPSRFPRLWARFGAKHW